ncbi:MAG: hypothetical protein DPW18_08240 [Chloroflexi bacterium]|nr:hypothetical protein [Chloroflexota bacterium]MDL1942878.1 sulfotransferase [Chloroflexi bacterium CFX2]
MPENMPVGTSVQSIRPEEKTAQNVDKQFSESELMPSRKPILVSGSHRSGTTWVGRMLAEAPGLLYIHEPFNVTDAPSRGVCNARFDHWFTYITRRNEAAFYEPIRNTVRLKYDLAGGLQTYGSLKMTGELLREYACFMKHRLGGSKALLKDPIAFFSAEWLAERFDMNVLMVIRHPAAFVSSIKKLNWRHPLPHFLAQPDLMRERLHPFEDEIKDHAAGGRDLIDEAVLLWKLIHHTMIQYRAAHTNWIFVRHEDLSRDPIAGYQELYHRLGLEFSARIQQVIKRYSAPANPGDTDAPVGSEEILMRNSASNIWNWKSRLTASEIERIRRAVQDISSAFYADEDW